MPRRLHRAIRALIVAVGIVVMMPTGTTRAHSLDSTTIAARLTDDTAEATVSLPLATLAAALDATDSTGSSLTDAEVIAYVDQHLAVTGTDGAVWDEIYASPSRTIVEGIDSFEVVVTFDDGTATPDELTITYDAIIESVPDHQAVVVLTDSTGDISTPGIFDDTNDRVMITDGGTGVAVSDMIQYGFEHVLDGADHLLFLVTLLLPAPLIAVGRRWQSAEGWRPAFIKVFHVVTAFTIGHSVTLIASALGWVRLPSRPVEVVIAISVGISALHAIRPLARNGEVMIAAGFGLVHGLAFAGILAGLGLEGRTSLVALLSFNIGIELAQLTATAVLFPSLYLASRTRCYPAIRVTGASMALAAAVAWALERLDALSNPFTPTEEWVIAHPLAVVGGLAALATLAVLTDRPERNDVGEATSGLGSGPRAST